MCREIPTSDEIQIAAVQFTLQWGNPHRQHVLMFWRQTLGQLGVISPLPRQLTAHGCGKSSVQITTMKLKHLFYYLHKAGKHGVKDVSSLFHDSHIPGGGVSALAILDGVDEAVSELAQRAQQILFDETDHVVI